MKAFISPTRSKKHPRDVRVFLEIDQTRYALTRIRCDDAIGRRAFRLVKDDGTIYDVIQTRFGSECDCPDYIFRREGLDPQGCKHIQALVAARMITPSCEQKSRREPVPARVEDVHEPALEAQSF
jgi:hypothetical protein